MTCAVAVFYPNVSTVLSILGGLCSVSICYTVPRKFERVSPSRNPYIICFSSVRVDKTIGLTLDRMEEPGATSLLRLPDHPWLRLSGQHSIHVGNGQAVLGRQARHPVQAVIT